MAEARPGHVDATLRHPRSGTCLHLVGTAHVSAASAEAAEEAVREIRPSAVAIELDEDRLRRMLQPESGGVGVGAGTSLSGVAAMALQGKIIQHVGALGYAAAGAVLGSKPGAEFIKAREAALEVGAEVVCVDRPATVTIARAYQAAAEQARRDSKAASAAVGSAGHAKHSQEEQRGGGSLLTAMEEAGCETPEATLRAAQRILNACMRGEEVVIDDLLQVRTCAKRVVENTRRRTLDTDYPVQAMVDEAALDDDSGTGTNEMKRNAWLAAFRVIADERDLILAHRMALLAERSGGLPVVGVVGAAHVRGIERRWADACAPGAEEAVAPLLAMPASYGAFGPFVASCAALLGFGALAARRFPRLVAVSSGAITGISAVGALAAANGIVRLETATQRLVKAARMLD